MDINGLAAGGLWMVETEPPVFVDAFKGFDQPRTGAVHGDRLQPTFSRLGINDDNRKRSIDDTLPS